MSKTFKKGGVFLFTVLSLPIVRIIFGLINLPDNITSWLFSFVFQALFMGLFPFLLYKALVEKDNKLVLKECRVKTPLSISAVLLAIPIGLLVYIQNIGSSVIWATIMTIAGFTYSNGAGVIYSSTEVLILEIITSAVLPAIFEEFVDRGMLLSAFEDNKNDKFKMFFIGIFFGLLHQNAPQLGPTAVVGVILVYMAMKCNNIIPGMIVHFMNNFFITITDYGTQKGVLLGDIYEVFTDFYLSNWIVLIAVYAIAWWLLVMLLKYFKRVTEVEPKEEKEDVQVKAMPSVYDIYGYPSPSVNNTYPRNTIMSEEEFLTSASGEKPKFFAYSLVWIAWLASLATTVMTFIWGFIR